MLTTVPCGPESTMIVIGGDSTNVFSPTRVMAVTTCWPTGGFTHDAVWMLGSPGIVGRAVAITGAVATNWPFE